MSELRDLLHTAADLGADFYDTLPTRPVYPEATADELREALGGPLPQRPSDPRVVLEQLADAADPGLVAEPSGRYFGFVIGGVGSGRTRRRLACDRLGPERRPLRLRAVRLGGRGGRRRVADRAARPARAGLVRLRHRRADGDLHGSRRGAAARARQGRLGRRARRADGRSAHSGRRRREPPRNRRPRAPDARARRTERHRPRRRERTDARRTAGAHATSRRFSAPRRAR